MLIPRDPCEQCVDIVGQAIAAPADILVWPDEGEAAPIELPRLWKIEIEHPERDRARVRGALQRSGVGRGGGEAQQREARAEAVEQRASRQTLLVEPQVRRASARNAARDIFVVGFRK